MSRLALVMIVRDEAALLPRCLSSLRGVVDEMVVLDTGSTDGTPEIAAALGARTERFAWCDDFAAARNAALALSDADWNLVLDADDWLESGAEALLAAQLGTEPFLGLVRINNRTDEGGRLLQASSWIPRLLPRGCRYEGRIHEQPVFAGPGRRLAVSLGHDGYRTERLARKGDRNLRLLGAALQQEPGDPYLHFCLGKEHQVAGDQASALDSFGRALAATPSDAPYRHALVVRALQSFRKAGLFDAGLQLAEAEFSHWERSPDFFFVLGDLYLGWAEVNPERAMSEALPMVEYSWRRCLEIGDRSDLDGTQTGTGSHLAAHNLSVFYETLGQDETAAHFRTLFPKGELELSCAA